MKDKKAKGISAARVWVSIRVGEMEKRHLLELAGLAGLSLSEYLRRRFFGHKPIIAHTDVNTVRELRRIGGLLKHNFETLRRAEASSECLQKQEEVLRLLQLTVDAIGEERK